MKKLFRIAILMVVAVALWTVAQDKTIFIVVALSVLALLVMIKVIRKRRKESLR